MARVVAMAGAMEAEAMAVARGVTVRVAAKVAAAMVVVREGVTVVVVRAEEETVAVEMVAAAKEVAVRVEPGEESDRMMMKESMTETMMKTCGREQPGGQSDTTMGSTVEHEHGPAGEVEHGEGADGEGEAGDVEHADPDEHVGRAGRHLADRDVQGTWGLAASEILGEQQPAGASPWA